MNDAGGLTYFAMELAEGEPLSHRIPAGGLPVETVVRFGEQVAAALAHAHERGIRARGGHRGDPGLPRVRRALRAYQSAYETLDARAAAAVYPAVDERALARAFAGLNSQKLEFERCEVTTQADGRARASCTGRAAYVPRVGNQTPRVEQRRWNFVLEANGDAWRIAQAQVSAR